MNYKLLLAGIIIPLLIAGCSRQPHFITDKSVRIQTERDFTAKQEALPHGNLFDVLNEEITHTEKEALTFLYAYMPIGDITDYSGEFYLRNIRSSFAVKEEMSWGKDIPEEIFRHFVLPVRVNNENMDESRMLFYEELKERVYGLSLYDAVLEVNHWCHEKVIYTPSDSRTSAPLASVRTAYGRCGEESVFTVAALRSVGIPARQVYTPRWAHTDNNHAWVEAWIDGKWYFLGACEPEPVLNLAWFNEPASRGMLMHCRVFGRYNGPEEIMETTDCLTEINVTANYAPTSTVHITVTDNKGAPVSDALTEFKLYNYAEFYTVAHKTTDSKGNASLSAGQGDMLVWVTKDGVFGYRKVSFGKDDSVTIALDKRPGDNIDLEMDIIPPLAHPIPAEVTEVQKEENARRLQEEDDIRNRYTATFYTEEKAKALAKELGVNAEKTTGYLQGSRGNWKEIESFLRTVTDKELPAAMDLLGVVSAKDLCDAPADVLLDHLVNSPHNSDRQSIRYILSPRVSNELLTAYRSFFRNTFSEPQILKFRENPHRLVEWTKENIIIRDNLNPQRIPVMPVGVWKARAADTHSRNIFFVSLARSLEIPARIEPVTGKVQYITENNAWADVDFETSIPVENGQGTVTAAYTPIKTVKNPTYYNHFTIAKILPNGRLQTLDFKSATVDVGDGDTWYKLLREPLAMEEGSYLLITGTRMAKGNVLAKVKSFAVAPGKNSNIALVMLENTDDIQVIGSIDAEAKFNITPLGKETSILATTGRGYFIIGILGSRQEPTNHAIRDISAVTNELNVWGRSIILLFKDEQDWKKFDRNEFGVLPGAITYGIDTGHKITKMIAEAMNLSNPNALPVFILADSFGRVVFVSQGYTIGLGDQLMQVIHKI